MPYCDDFWHIDAYENILSLSVWQSLQNRKLRTSLSDLLLLT